MGGGVVGGGCAQSSSESGASSTAISEDREGDFTDLVWSPPSLPDPLFFEDYAQKDPRRRPGLTTLQTVGNSAPNSVVGIGWVGAYLKFILTTARILLVDSPSAAGVN